jgi:hypothetical protein
MGDFGIKLNNTTFLDLYPNTSFNYVLNSPFYLGGELGDPIAGNLIFSVKVPLTPRNNKLLRFPGLIDNAIQWIQKANCSVYTEGAAIWFGKLDIIAPSAEREANIRITINTAPTLQTLKMNALDLGSFNATTQNPYTWANETVANPDTQNFNFAPIWNPNFWATDKPRSFQDSEKQNICNDASGFKDIPNSNPRPSLTPFPKLNFVLSKMMSAVGYRLNNHFQNTHELSRLMLYTNASLVAKDGTFSAANFPLSYGLSDTVSSVFIRNLCRKFALGLFFDDETQTIDLIPFNQVANSAAKHDWTKKQLSGYELTRNLEYPSVLADKLTDTIISSNQKSLPVFEDYPSDIDGIEGIYKTNNLVYYHKNLKATSTIIGFRQLTLSRLYDEVNLNNPTGTRYENDIGTLNLSRKDYDNYVDFPSLAQLGKIQSDAHNSENTTPDRLLFYRGISRHGLPFASAETKDTQAYDIKVNSSDFTEFDAQHSLNWSGDKGIYNRFWKENHQVVANGKLLKRKIGLTINDLLRFSFKDKVRLDNQECFVKKISGVLNRNGLQPADVEFVTTT